MIESVDIMSEIYELEQIRRRISERYRSDPNIRINVSLRQPRLHLRDVPVKITGVYRHIFQVEETSSKWRRPRPDSRSTMRCNTRMC